MGLSPRLMEKSRGSIRQPALPSSSRSGVSRCWGVSLTAAPALQGGNSHSDTRHLPGIPTPNSLLHSRHQAVSTSPRRRDRHWRGWGFGHGTSTSTEQLCPVPGSGERPLGAVRSSFSAARRPGSQSQKDLLLNPSPALAGLSEPLALSEPCILLYKMG